MRILLVSEFFPSGEDLIFSGGVEARSLFIAKYLAKKNQVIVLTSKIEGDKKEEEMLGFKVLRVGPSRHYNASIGDIFNRLKFINSAITVGQRVDCDIVEGSNFITHFIARSIANNKKIPAVAWYPDVWIGSWIKNAGPLGIIGEVLERLNLLRGFDAYISISKTTSAKLKKHIQNHVDVITCGVELSEFQKYTNKSRIPTIITISRLTKYKNIDKLILAFALILLNFKNLKLIIVGTGPQEKYLKNLVSQLHISSNVKFISNLPRLELTKILRQSQILSLPSEVEGFGITVLEACAAGVPYVVSDIDVFKEVTKNGQGGLLFKSGSAKDLAQKLEHLLSDKKLYSQKTKEATVLARNYDWQEIANETEELYKKVIKNKPK